MKNILAYNLQILQSKALPSVALTLIQPITNTTNVRLIGTERPARCPTTHPLRPS